LEDDIRKKEVSRNILKGNTKVLKLENFQSFQLSILKDIEGRTAYIENCPREFKTILDETQKYWNNHSCPNTANKDLFNILDIPVVSPKMVPANEFAKQVERVKFADRQLNITKDKRCIGFEPTDFQIRIMNANNIIVRSPSSTGKTMMSLYLAHKTKSLEK
jgi:hypothetical protein